MKILFISKSNFAHAFQSGRQVEFPKTLAALNHQISLIGASYTNHTPIAKKGFYDEVKLISIGNSVFFMGIIYFIKLFATLVSILIITRSKPDVIIVDFSSVLPSLFFAFLSHLRIISVKFVLDIRTVPVEVTGFHGIAKNAEYCIAIWLAKFFFHGITVITPQLRDDIAKNFAIDQNQIGVWCSGASLSTFDPAKAKIPADTEKLQGKFVVMHHGGLGWNRGQQQTIDAIELLVTDYPDIVLFLLGAGPTAAELQEKVILKNLKNNVYIHSAVPYEDVFNYLALADVGIIVLPNIGWWRVSSPQKLMEYLAMEKPVIVTDILAHRNVLKDEACAIYISSIEADEIAAAIKFTYQHRAELPVVGKIGRKIVEQNYTWHAQACQLIKYLEKIIK